eukprot:4884951-Pyramimonas_sp.AAC.1
MARQRRHEGLERVAAVAVVGRGVCVDIVGVYMPHVGKPDVMVEAVYESIDTLLGASALLVIAGDFNAEVGSGC